MHIILVRVVRSIQNSCKNTPLKTNILLQCSLTLTILIIKSEFLLFYWFNLIEISFIRQLFMCLMSVITPMEFSRAEYSTLFRRNIRNLRYL
jgi:hypothetical protein